MAAVLVASAAAGFSQEARPGDEADAAAGGNGGQPDLTQAAEPVEPETVEAIAAGELVAVGGAGGAATACFSCHGLTGFGDDVAGFPRLAGLDAQYLEAQLAAFADGSRPDDVMSSIAGDLTSADRRNVAAFYASLPVPAGYDRAEDPALIRNGGVLFAVGRPENGIAPCGDCHGADAQGMGALFPPLAGQPEPYLAGELFDFRTGRRSNDPSAVMRDIATHMSDEDIAALAAYLSSLRP